MFKACDADGDSCERVNKNGFNFLNFSKRLEHSGRTEGIGIEAQDPRLFECGGRKYVMFIGLSPFRPSQLFGIALTPFDEFKPVFLRIRNTPYNVMEKNWAPFVKNGQIHFVYNYDPLIILRYDGNPEGWCNVVYSEARLPFRTEVTFLRGGSNLVPFRDNLLIGGCHSRIEENGVFYHFTHMVVLDIDKWKVVHLSKPVRFEYSKEDIGTVDGAIYEINPNCIQDPISLYKKDDGYYMSINVRDCISLLYKLEIDMDTFERPREIQAFTEQCAFEIVKAHRA